MFMCVQIRAISLFRTIFFFFSFLSFFFHFFTRTMSHTTSNNPHTSDITLIATPFLHYIPTSPPSQELDFHLPSRTPLHGLTVSEWAGTKTRHNSSSKNEIK